MGEMYIDKVRVGNDVPIYYTYKHGYYDDCDKLFYLTDWDNDKKCGTLKVYQGDKVTKIADDVYDYVVTNEGRAIYLITAYNTIWASLANGTRVKQEKLTMM